MEKWKRRAVELMASLAFGGPGDPSVVPFYPQKTTINMPEKPFFQRSTPEKHGISSKRIYNMLCELEGEKRANIHTIMVLRHGEVISECSADCFDRNSWHISNSMAKTVCGMVIGTLIDEGRLKLGDRLVDIFPEIEYRDKKFQQITIEHLLSMTCGVDFAEPGAITSDKWMADFFLASVKFIPGTKFAYNSMNTYILARTAERVSRIGFGELARTRIFAPLDIKNYLWEKSPEGTEKGGWGLYLSAESWAKLGVMMASDGVFAGKRILSSEWVKEFFATRAIAPDFNGNFNYAFHMWTAKVGEEYLFNGMLGQNVWICPRNDIVVVMLGGNNELFGASPALEIVRKHLGGKISDKIHRRDLLLLREKEATFFESRRWVKPREKGTGLLFWLRIKSRTLFDERWSQILGRYGFAENNVGMMPLMVRAMQNNLCSRIEEILIRREGEALYIDYKDGGEIYSLRVGLYGYERNVINLHGEPYIVWAAGEATVSKNGEIEYKIELILSETASVRRLLIRKNADKITIDFGESPNNRVVESLLNQYRKNNNTLAFAVDVIEKRLGEGSVEEILYKAFHPTLVGADVSSVNYEEIIFEETKRALEAAEKVKGIRSLVDRFFKDNEPEKNKRETPSIEKVVKKSISDILGIISGKVNQNNAK